MYSGIGQLIDGKQHCFEDGNNGRTVVLSI